MRKLLGCTHRKATLDHIQFRNCCLLVLLLVFPLILTVVKAQKGLKAEYYDGQNFDRLVTTRIENKIDQQWDETPPVEGIDPHNCSIRWSGQIMTSVTGRYTFSARVDDGIRVWVENNLIIDDWRLNDVGRFKGDVDLVAGKYYDLKVEYFNALIEGEIQLLWKMPNDDRKWYNRYFDQQFQVIAPEFFFYHHQNFTTNNWENTVKGPVDLSKPTPPFESKATTVLKENDSKEKTVTDVSNKFIVKQIIPTNAKYESMPSRIEEYIPKNIQFERAETSMLIESYRELDKFAEFMNKNPEFKVKIEGHTEPIGNEDQNQKLSERRAYTVASYLVKKGIVASRIKVEGLGGSKPLVVPAEGEYFPANRRVEFIMSEIQ